MIPGFNSVGDLPIGIHEATMDEIRLRFGEANACRQSLFARLCRIHAIAKATSALRRFVVFGSFITSKSEPNDVDVFLLMNDEFDYSATTGEVRLLFDHMSAETCFGASVFWLRIAAAWEGEQTAVENWQLKRDGNRRGIIDIVEVETTPPQGAQRQTRSIVISDEVFHDSE